MPYTLVIVESPAKCNKIEQYLGPKYKCMASFGHIRILKDLNSIAIENNFLPTFTAMDSKKQQIYKLRSAIKSASEVMLATDDDREGEAIAWHICDTFSLSPTSTKRIIFHEITKSALTKAVENPITLNMNVVYAQQARQVLDLLVGFKISPILWNNITKKTKSSLSAGRCQTPALRLIYDNQKDIDNSPGDKIYQTTGYFTNKNIAFQLSTQFTKEDEMQDFLEKSVTHTHIYKCGPPRKIKKQPPEPFTTSTLQQKASNEYKFSPKQTMALCQKLYEAGLITYMRTDSKSYSSEFIHTVKKYVEANKEYSKYIHDNVDRLSERNKNSDNNAQEAHEAIRPTDISKKNVDDMELREQKMYSLIWRNTLESCMAHSEHVGITASITAPSLSTSVTAVYKFSTEKTVFPGWKIVSGYEDTEGLFTYLKSIKGGIEMPYKKITSKISIKNLKSHYTEAKLVNVLEKQGIGRPSTFSSLVDKIQERGYVKKTNVKGKMIKCVDFELQDDKITEVETEREFGGEKGKLVIQPIGGIVVDFLIKHFDELFQYDYTKNMEDTLDSIASGDKIWYTLCDECNRDIMKQAAKLTDNDRITIQIDKQHTYMIGKYGPVIRKKSSTSKKDSFLSVRKDIDMIKLKNGDYTLDELLIKDDKYSRVLGKHKNKNVTLQEGRYGLYVSWNSINKSVDLDDLKKQADDICLEDFISTSNNIFQSNHQVSSETSPRNLGIYNNEKISKKNSEVILRDGKYGAYVRWNGKNYSVSKLHKPLLEIKLQDVIPYLVYTPKRFHK